MTNHAPQSCSPWWYLLGVISILMGSSILHTHYYRAKGGQVIIGAQADALGALIFVFGIMLIVAVAYIRKRADDKKPHLVEDKQAFTNQTALMLWSAFACILILIGAGGFLSESWKLAVVFSVGSCLVWYIGFLILKGNHYFVSNDGFGYRDIFGIREVQFEKIVSASLVPSRYGATLVVVCKDKKDSFKIDILAYEDWLNLVKEKLRDKCGINL